MNKFRFIADNFKPLLPQYLMVCLQCVDRLKLRTSKVGICSMPDPDAPGCMLCGEKEFLYETLVPHKSLLRIYKTDSIPELV